MSRSGISVFKSKRLQGFLFGALLAGGVAAWLYGPRPALGERPSDVVLALVEDRCMPHVRFGLPLNTSGLEPVWWEAFDRAAFHHEATQVVVSTRRVDGENACEIGTSGGAWPQEDREHIHQSLVALGEEWVGETSEFRDLTSASIGELYVYRPTDGHGRFLLWSMDSTPTVVVSIAAFSDGAEL